MSAREVGAGGTGLSLIFDLFRALLKEVSGSQRIAPCVAVFFTVFRILEGGAREDTNMSFRGYLLCLTFGGVWIMGVKRWSGCSVHRCIVSPGSVGSSAHISMPSSILRLLPSLE